jgi:hypothetical protein
MSAKAVEARFKQGLDNLGRATLSALFPKDIENYMIALELINSKGNTVDYFAWPILPDELRETDNAITNIRKTMSAINVLKNPSFNSRQISIRGDFGRRFKLLLGAEQVTFAGFGFSLKNGKFNISPPKFLQNPVPQFSTIAKTGYGCVKVLEAMKEKSKQLDENGKPYVLFLYNPILGNNYQVEFATFSQSQDKSHYNMFPSYNIQLTAVAPLDSILSRRNNLKSAIKNLTVNGLQRTANELATNLRLRV